LGLKYFNAKGTLLKNKIWREKCGFIEAEKLNSTRVVHYYFILVGFLNDEK
jgi:hypothetical protein